MKLSQVLKITLPSVLIASLCCLSPLVFVLLGASLTSFGVVLFTRALAPYEWAFFAAGLAFLIGSLTLYFRTRGICTLEQARKSRNEVVNTTLMVLLAALVSFAIFFGAVAIAGKSRGLW